MSASSPTAVLDISRTDVGDDLVHWTQCHDRDRSLCGLDLTGSTNVDGTSAEVDCVVCVDLEPFHCGCGCGCCGPPRWAW